MTLQYATGEKVEIDLLERDLVLTSRNRVQPDATSCDMPCKGLGCVSTLASRVPRTPHNWHGVQGVGGSNPLAPTSFQHN